MAMCQLMRASGVGTIHQNHLETIKHIAIYTDTSANLRLHTELQGRASLEFRRRFVGDSDGHVCENGC